MKGSSLRCIWLTYSSEEGSILYLALFSTMTTAFSFKTRENRILQISYSPTRQDEPSYKNLSTMLSSVPEVVILEMWQARKRGLCTWYALVREMRVVCDE